MSADSVIQLNEHAYPHWLANFINTYQALNTQNLETLAEIYHDEVNFKDPIHEISGYQNLYGYFKQLYTNLTACTFEVTKVLYQENEAALYWRMSFVHSKLKQGNIITVEGHSFLLAQDEKVIYHRDYVDLGAMLYEHIPLLGRLVKLIKQRASQ